MNGAGGGAYRLGWVDFGREKQKQETSFMGFLCCVGSATFILPNFIFNR